MPDRETLLTRKSTLSGLLAVSIFAVLLVFALAGVGIIPQSEQQAILRTASVVGAMASGYLIVRFTTLQHRWILAVLVGLAVLIAGLAVRVVLAQ